MTGWSWLGRVRYGPMVEQMESVRARLIEDEQGAGRLFLCEHEPVVTFGRGADRKHLLVSDESLAVAGVEQYASSRGGDVTYHGPGQLMIYPVVRLRRGLLPYLESVATAVAKLAEQVGVPGAAWRRDPAGVWVGDRKLAACGVHIRRRVAIHGFSLNVCTPPQRWRLIVPCGLSQTPISLSEHLGESCPSVQQIAQIAGPIISSALRL